MILHELLLSGLMITVGGCGAICLVSRQAGARALRSSVDEACV